MIYYELRKDELLLYDTPSDGSYIGRILGVSKTKGGSGRIEGCNKEGQIIIILWGATPIEKSKICFACKQEIKEG